MQKLSLVKMLLQRIRSYLYDDDIYTYTNLAGTKAVEGWLGLNK